MRSCYLSTRTALRLQRCKWKLQVRAQIKMNGLFHIIIFSSRKACLAGSWSLPRLMSIKAMTTTISQPFSQAAASLCGDTPWTQSVKSFIFSNKLGKEKGTISSVATYGAHRALTEPWSRGSGTGQTVVKPFYEPHSYNNLAQKHPNDHNSQQKFLQIIVSPWVPHAFHYKTQYKVGFQNHWTSSKQTRTADAGRMSLLKMIHLQ